MTFKSKGNISWRAPLGMLAALVAGICLAAGHHAFYTSLQGREVSDHQYRVGGWTASSQQVNTAAGTAFAFVVKASLVLASAIAYTQLYFRALTTSTNSLQKLDRWFSGLHDFVSLCYLPTYWRHGLLALVAITVWLLPIAAIIAPAALSVTFSQLQYPPTSSHAVPQPAFDSLAFLSSHSYNTTLTGFPESSSFDPDQEVLRVASAAAASGSILPIEAPSVNASWQITIEAPKMACENMDSDFQTQLKENLLEGLQPSITSLGEPLDFQSMFSYLAWSSWTNLTSDEQGNEVNTTIRLPFTMGIGQGMEFLAQPKNSADDFYVAAFPRANTMPPRSVWNSTNGGYPFGRSAMDWYFETATLLQCRQAATSYHIGFEYNGPNQEQHVNVISANDVDPSWQSGQPGAGQTSSLEIHNKYNLRYNSVNAIWTTAVSLILGASNANAVRLGSAELWSFSTNATGLFRRDYETQVFSTSLANTIELAAITPAQITAQDPVLGNNPTQYSLDGVESLLSPVRGETTDQQHLSDALEELFFNITISMASSPRLLYNASSLFAPSNVTVTFNLYGNVYDYDLAKLWLPYGLAIAVTVLNVAIGLFSIFQTGASFTADFSTIIRMAKNAEVLGADTMEATLPGKDPLPRMLAGSKFALRPGQVIVEHELRSVQGTKNYREVSQTEDGESSR